MCNMYNTQGTDCYWCMSGTWEMLENIFEESYAGLNEKLKIIYL